MKVITEIALKNGRVVRSDSLEFRERMPISADMLDRIGNADDTLEGAFEVISAVANAVLMLESRGVQLDD